MIRNKPLITFATSLLGAGYITFASAGPGAGMSFESLDGNGDGTISLEEFTANAPSGRRRSPEDIFNRLDANEDGHVSQQELDAMRKRRQGRS